jgi:hypothetical protein
MFTTVAPNALALTRGNTINPCAQPLAPTSTLPRDALVQSRQTAKLCARAAKASEETVRLNEANVRLYVDDVAYRLEQSGIVLDKEKTYDSYTNCEKGHKAALVYKTGDNEYLPAPPVEGSSGATSRPMDWMSFGVKFIAWLRYFAKGEAGLRIKAAASPAIWRHLGTYHGWLPTTLVGAYCVESPAYISLLPLTGETGFATIGDWVGHRVFVFLLYALQYGSVAIERVAAINKAKHRWETQEVPVLLAARHTGSDSMALTPEVAAQMRKPTHLIPVDSPAEDHEGHSKKKHRTPHAQDNEGHSKKKHRTPHAQDNEGPSTKKQKVPAK